MARLQRTVSAALLAAAVLGIAGPIHRARAATGRGIGREKKKEQVIPKILREAAKGTSRKRRESIGQLGSLRDREAIRQWKVVEALVGFTRDRSPRVAQVAAKALGDLVQWDRSIKEKARDPLVKVLQNSKAHVIIRRESATQLGLMCSSDDFSDRDATNALVKAAKTTRTNPPEVAAAALRALGRIGDSRARTVILAGMSHADPLVRAAATEALEEVLAGPNVGKFLGADLNRILLGLLRGGRLDPEARAKVLLVIARAIREGQRIDGAETLVVKMLREEKEPDVMVVVLEAARLMGGTKTAPVLPEVYKRFSPDKNEEKKGSSEVRLQVCETVGELFAFWSSKQRGRIPATAAKVLIDLLETAVMGKEGDVAVAAADALGNLYDRRYDRTKAVAILIAVVGAEGVAESLKKTALDSIEVVIGRSIKDPEGLEKWFRGNLRLLRPHVR